MGVVVVASGSSPSVYIRGLIRRIDRGDPNVIHCYVYFQASDSEEEEQKCYDDVIVRNYREQLNK